eukprot:m.244048 g.244048  ORF g.244048 m.244048 type:complete len:384 (-) comp14376_c0_seq1:352-1503(-)
MLKSFARLFNAGDKKHEPAVKTNIEVLGSQGSRTSKDASAAFLHASTSPPNYYLYMYGLKSINMDRGGFGHARNGTNFGCIFDGVTSGGKINAYAAQAFTDFFLNWLAENHAMFCYGADHSVIDVAKKAFEEATRAANNPGLENTECQAEGGSATGGIVAFDRIADDLAVLHGASIGDAAVISVSMRDGLARQLNPVFRKHDRDTGGQLTMCFGVDGPVWCFSHEVHADEFIVLATDGLTDNIVHDELDRIVPLIMRCSIFDTIVPFECEEIFKSPPERPGYLYMVKISKDALEPLSAVTCDNASRRLFHYVEWVTRFDFNMEEQFYMLSIRMREAKTDADRKALEAQIAHMTAQRKTTKKVVKTDDAMIIVMRPFHTAVPPR